MLGVNAGARFIDALRPMPALLAPLDLLRGHVPANGCMIGTYERTRAS